MASKAIIEITRKSGKLKKVIGAEISDELSKTATIDEQIAIVMNALEVIFDKLEEVLQEELRPEDFSKYEKLRELTKLNKYKEYNYE